MKKLICFFILLLTVFIAPHVQAAAIKGSLCLTGGGNCLDGIDGNNFVAGDGAVTIFNDSGTYKGYLHVCVESSATEASPVVITPNSNPGTKRWHLVKMVTADTYAELVAKWTGCTGYLKHDGTCDSGDSLGTALYNNVVALWASGSCTGYMRSNGLCDSGDNLGNASYSNVVGLWEVGCAGYLKSDGTCDTGGSGSGGSATSINVGGVTLYMPTAPPEVPSYLTCPEVGTCYWTTPSTDITLAQITELLIPLGIDSSTNGFIMCGYETDGNQTIAPCGEYVEDNSTNGYLVKKVVTGGTPTMENAVAGTDYAAPNSDTTGSAAKMPVNAATDATGKESMDSTTGQHRYYDGANQHVLTPVNFFSFVIPAPATSDDIIVMKAPYGMTITNINCIVQGTTSVTGQMQECTSAGASCTDLDSDITCDADGAADDGTLTDSTIASGAWLRWKTTSLSGTPTFLTVTVKYKVVAD